MKKIRELVGRKLIWQQPSGWREEYELRDGEEIAATLRFKSSMGSFATYESGDGIWTFKRVGFWKPHVTIRQPNSEQDLAIFRNSVWKNGGILEVLGGAQYRISSNFWNSRFEIENAAKGVLVDYRRAGGLLRLSCEVEISRDAAEVPILPWLVGLGFYVAILMRRDSAMAGGIAAAAAAS